MTVAEANPMCFPLEEVRHLERMLYSVPRLHPDPFEREEGMS